MSTDPTTPPGPPAPAPAGPGWFRRNWIHLVGYVLAVITASVVASLEKAPVVLPPAPVLVQVDQPPQPVAQPEAAGAQGWVIDPDAVQAVAAQLPVRVFADTPAGKATDIPGEVFLWKAYDVLFARPPPIKNQGQVGSCVSFGTNNAVERTLANEILARKGSRDEWSTFVEEATYGGSRVEIGHGQIRGDGSVGAWAAKFVTQYGMVPRQKYPTDDLSAYSESRCRQWGQTGVPGAYEAVAKTYPVKSFVQVTTWDEAKKALASGYAVAVCSNQGFAAQRDANGVAAPSGHWGHCMCLDGYHIDGPSGREYGHIENSWGTTYSRGPVGWGNPNPSGFWADSTVVASMLRAGDSWAMSGVTGFPRRKLNWIIARPTPRPLAATLGDHLWSASPYSLAF